MPDLVTDLRRRIAEAADPDRAPAMQAYMKSTLPFRGVGSPVLHRICREAVGQHPPLDRVAWEDAVRELWDDARYREERYAALAVAGDRRYRGHRDPASLDLDRHLVVSGAWWDLVDAVATRHVGDVLERHRVDATPVVRAWAGEDDLWLRRTAVLAQLKHREATDTTLLREVLDRNDLTPDAAVSCIFTCTDDLTAEFPAVAARQLGFDRVPLLCAKELSVAGSLPRVIRLLLHYYAPEDHVARHVYLHEARRLRSDLDAAQ